MTSARGTRIPEETPRQQPRCRKRCVPSPALRYDHEAERVASASSSRLLVTAPVRLLIPNITGFLALTIPIAMSIGQTAGLNPVICGLVVMIAGDAVLHYPAQSASSLVAYVVVLTVALPYWAIVGEPLRLSPGP
jgi:hypothetical protein